MSRVDMHIPQWGGEQATSEDVAQIRQLFLNEVRTNPFNISEQPENFKARIFETLEARKNS